jgi:thiol:disulfide interchange protein DsbD
MVYNIFRNWKAVFPFVLFAGFCLLVFSPIYMGVCSAEPAEEEYYDADAPNEASMQMPSEDPVTFALLAEEKSIKPGKPLWLAIDVGVLEGWHGYWKNPGATGIPLQITWNLPENFSVGELQWPYPTRFDQNGLIGYGYDRPITLLTPLNSSSSIASEKAQIEATITWLVCSESLCLPGESTLVLDLPISQEAPSINDSHHELFAKARAAIPNENIKTEVSQQKGFIEIQVDLGKEEKSTFDSAQFFSANRGTIDFDSAELKIQNSTYLVTMKPAKNQAEQLQGVLVLRNKDSARAIAIDQPIQGFSNDAVAMADDIKSRSKSLEESPVAFEGGILVALILAFIGGAILNLMPCVFPVISFKILSFVNMAGKNRRYTLFILVACEPSFTVSFLWS